MSENLKRAESLFNRIMNQNGSQTQFKSTAHSNNPNPNSHHQNHHHQRDHHNHNHNNNHQNRRFKYELLNHPALKLPQQITPDLSDYHILPFCWTIWFHSRYRKKESGDDKQNYLKRTRDIEFPKFGDDSQTTKYIASVEQMWVSLSSLRKATDLSIGTEFFVFKGGINPAWEDPFNTKGGRWIFKFSRRFVDNEANVEKIRTRTGLIWERLLLRLMSGTLISQEYGEEIVNMMLSDINGIVLSIRKDEDIISLWNSNLNYRNNKKVSNFQGKRILCDSILRVIRECDEILAGGDVIKTTSTNTNDRVKGVLFEYRLHADYNNDGDKFRNSRKKDHHQPKEEQEPTHNEIEDK